MSNLYLLCGLCGRTQADGLLSRGYWGHLELGRGNALRACPTCKEQHSDWETKLRAGASPSALDVSGFSQVDSATGLA
jgi:hypothetical protein